MPHQDTQGLNKKIRIAHLSGPNATIQNSPPLVTSNQARARHGLPLLQDVEGNRTGSDLLRAQKLAAPVTVYVEQFTAHPMEADAAELYGPPDGYLDAGGVFSQQPSEGARAVYEVLLSPEDGYYMLPYMARTADGVAWEDDGTSPRTSRAQSRQPFYPDGKRVFDEIDRFGLGGDGRNNLISARASVDFYRLAPPAGYTKGLPADQRTDIGTGDIPPESPDRDFFPYRPVHLSQSPPRMALARIANMAQRILSSGDYDGAIWTQGSPRIEEAMYWFNLVLDVTIPLCGNASQRYHGEVSADGPKNIVDSVEYLESRVWADAEGRNLAGMVMVQDQRVFAAREVAKVDARPGGYVATGGHGGILGAAGSGVGSVLRYIPVTRHTWQSEVNISKLPAATRGVTYGSLGIETVAVAVKSSNGELLETAIPKVPIIKDASFIEDDELSDPDQEVDVIALVDYMLKSTPLAGFVLEGLSPYGKASSTSRTRALTRAVYSGIPVVGTGRGNTEGFAIKGGAFIAGSNLTSVKARVLLMLCIMKFGMLPPARDPAHPTADEVAAVAARLVHFQKIFDTH
jgi:L-asparaginase